MNSLSNHTYIFISFISSRFCSSRCYQIKFCFCINSRRNSNLGYIGYVSNRESCFIRYTTACIFWLWLFNNILLRAGCPLTNLYNSRHRIYTQQNGLRTKGYRLQTVCYEKHSDADEYSLHGTISILFCFNFQVEKNVQVHFKTNFECYHISNNIFCR